MGRTTRVLLVGNDPDYFLSHRLSLALALNDLGYDLHVAIPYELHDQRFSNRRFILHRISLRRGGMRPSEELRTILELFTLYRRLKPDIVHHVTLKPTLYGGFAALVTRIPIVVNAMTGLGYVFRSTALRAKLIRAVARIPLRLACRRKNVTMVFQNPEDRDTFADLGLSYKAVLIRGSGVDTGAFYPSVRDSAAEPIVMVAARMLWDKGIAEFVEAARSLKKAGVRARFVLVGGTDPNPSSVPEAVLKAWTDDGSVEWWGRRDDMPSVWRQAQIACLPSYAEGLPKSLLEAAATGLPLVATDIPGCREIVRDELTGLLVAKGDAGQLARALERLIRDPLLRHRLGNNARATVQAEFTVQSVINQTADLYKSLVNDLGMSLSVVQLTE